MSKKGKTLSRLRLLRIYFRITKAVHPQKGNGFPASYVSLLKKLFVHGFPN